MTVYLVTGDHPNKLYSDNSHFFLRLLNISSNKTVTNCITISHPWSGELDKNLLENISNLKKKANFPCLVDMELFFLRPLFSEQSFFYSFKYIIDYGSKELNHLNKNYFKTTIDEMQKEVLKIIEAIRSTHEEQL